MSMFQINVNTSLVQNPYLKRLLLRLAEVVCMEVPPQYQKWAHVTLAVIWKAVEPSPILGDSF